MTNYSLHLSLKNYTTISDLYDLLESAESFEIYDAPSGMDYSSNNDNWEMATDHYVTDLYITLLCKNEDELNDLISSYCYDYKVEKETTEDSNENNTNEETEEEIEILEIVNPINDEIESIEFSNEIIEIIEIIDEKKSEEIIKANEDNDEDEDKNKIEIEFVDDGDGVVYIDEIESEVNSKITEYINDYLDFNDINDLFEYEEFIEYVEDLRNSYRTRLYERRKETEKGVFYGS